MLLIFESFFKSVTPSKLPLINVKQSWIKAGFYMARKILLPGRLWLFGFARRSRSRTTPTGLRSLSLPACLFVHSIV